ncbi:uncharacterized protein LOC110642792 isoform X1 [Hevea brasiliensis]|uniref:uncharacterized protein LOC110642792 isoform X1 n=1 Tax=Hevea brasiliensis TaxID=3981 RepID=UPI0025DC1D93|nr:uncharacterized protein LOC110642792 isoform X1 [Hevea brasiliensis]
MFDYGDEFTIETYRIPWLIWIQILIFFLLIFLLCCFSVFTSDLSHYNTKTPSSSTSPSSLASASASTYLNNPLLNHSTTTTLANRLQHNQGPNLTLLVNAAIKYCTKTSRVLMGFLLSVAALPLKTKILKLKKKLKNVFEILEHVEASESYLLSAYSMDGFFISFDVFVDRDCTLHYICVYYMADIFKCFFIVAKHFPVK